MSSSESNENFYKTKLTCQIGKRN